MQFNPTALVVLAAFVGLLWYAIEQGPAAGALATIVAVVVNVLAGWLIFTGATNLPRWRSRRDR